MIYTDDIKKAIIFSSSMHKDQKRMIVDVPYISHPMTVLFIISQVTDDEDIRVASILHDVIEDCNVSPDTIEKEFGKKARDIVVGLTDESPMLVTIEQKYASLEKFKNAPPAVLLIKTADIIANFADFMYVLENYPKETYFKYFGSNLGAKIDFIQARLDVLASGWPENPLTAEAYAQWEEYKKILHSIS